MSDYYVTLERLGRFGLRSKEIGRYPDQEGAVVAAKKYGPGTYDVVTHWDGEFDREHIKVTVDQTVFIATGNLLGPSWVKLGSRGVYTQYVVDLAIVVNSFYSEEEKEAARKRIREYEATH